MTGDSMMSRIKVLSRLTLLATVLVSLLASHFAYKSYKRALHDQFRMETRESFYLISRRIDVYIEAALGINAFFASSAEVTRLEWNRYIETLGIWESHPGIVSLGFIRPIPESDEEEFTRLVRSDKSVRPDGYPSFAIHPGTGATTRLVVDYIEPFALNREMHGYDLTADPYIAEKARRIADSGKLSIISKPFPPESSSGLTILLPVYRNSSTIETAGQRRSAFLGFIACMIDIDKLLKGVMTENLASNMVFEIIDLDSRTELPSGQGQPIYSSHSKADAPDMASEGEGERKKLEVGDRLWEIHFHPTNRFLPRFSRSPAAAVLVIGIIIGLLLYRLVKTLELRLAAERETENIGKWLAVVAEHSNELVWELDSNGYYTYVSPVIMKFIGFVPREVIGKHHSEFFHPDDRDNLLTITSEAFRNREPFRGFTCRHLHKDGRSIFLYFSGVPITGEGGKFLGFRGLTRNITKIRQTEEKLLAAKEAAEEANQMKVDFIANMSHELNTPMSSIIGFTKLLQKTKLDADQEKFLSIIDKCSENLLRQISELLELSNIEMGKTTLADSVFNPRELIETHIDSIRAEAERKGLTLRLHIGENLPILVRGDFEKLHHVLRMLLSNAIKFTESGEIVAGVSVRDKTDMAANLHFFISDTGIGIPEEKKGLLFEAFKQLDGSLTRKYGGIGIGLATSKRLVRIMGGELWFESEDGKGSVFHIAIPFKPA